MKKNLLVLFALLCCITGFSQGVVVRTDNFGSANPTQLTNYLLGSGNSCLVQPANATKTIAPPAYPSGNSVGTFQDTGTTFPFREGVVLASGNVLTVSGPNTRPSDDFSADMWNGDADLEAAFAAAGITINSMNASVLEFDFTAATPVLSIPYIFASKEYGQFQCTSKDGFVILIKPASSPNSAYQNIATVPGTNLPVSVATVRSNLNNAACSSENSQYFGAFYGGGSAASAPINSEGVTVPLTATYTLTPGVTYHLKIVVADDGNANNNLAGTDGQKNSSVFIPAGLVNLGQLLVGTDRTTANNTALCQGDQYTINTQLTGSQYTFRWTRGATQVGTASSITVTDSGTYTLQVTNTNTNCTSSQSVVIEFAPRFTPGTPANLYACPNGTGGYTYNLAANTPNLLQGNSINNIVTYHASQAAAENGTAALNATAYNTTGGTERIFARIKSYNSSCYAVVPFDLFTLPAPTATNPQNLQACETTPGSGVATVNLTAQNPAILGSQPAADYVVTYFTSQANANSNTDAILTPGSYPTATTTSSRTQTIYARVQNTQNTACYATASFTITVNAKPEVSTGTDITVCAAYPLPAITNGNYYTGPNGTGDQLAAGTPINSPQTIYIYNTNAAGCSNQSSFTITVLTTALIPQDVNSCGAYTLPALGEGQEYHLQPNGGGAAIAAGTLITTTTRVYFYIPTAASCTANTSFLVSVVDADDPADVVSCGPYTLPPLTNGNYYTGPGGTGTRYNAGRTIPATQTLYVYNSNAATGCTVEHQFEITISPVVTPRGNVRECNSYTLPPLTVGAYYTQQNGVGPITNTRLTTSQTVYIYYADPANPTCTSEVSFEVEILPPPAITGISNQIACGSYTLPIGNNIEYYSTSREGGTRYEPGQVITASTTLYAFTNPSADGCRNNRSFTVTIIGAVAVTPGDQTACDSYTLPVLAVGNYYTLPGGPATSGNRRLTAGTPITTTATIYVYVESTNTTPACTSEGSFTVTITRAPSLPNFNGVVACDSYTLPPLTAGAYYGSPNGVDPIAEGTIIPATKRIWVYASNGPDCSTERNFNIRIIPGTLVQNPAITACGSYSLPALPYGAYYNGPNGTGGEIPVGTPITTDRTIYVYGNVTTGTNCTGDDFFTVDITDVPMVDTPANVAACNFYDLPPLTNGNYYTGRNGTGLITLPHRVTNTTTFYIYNTTPGCDGAEHEFTVTINKITVTALQDRTVCANEGYVLPPYPAGATAYYEQPGGPTTPGNIRRQPGYTVSTNRTIYVFGSVPGTSPLCYDEKPFTVTTVAPPSIDDPGLQVSCGSYTLLPLTVGGAYYTGPGGTGTQLTAGQVINSSQTIYIYAQSGGTPNCVSENEMQIIVNPEAPGNVTACDRYELPELPAGQHYYTARCGGGIELLPGDYITRTRTVYFYIPTAASCTCDASFEVVINITPVLAPVTENPVVRCDEYELPVLTVGTYYTAPGGPTGGGTPMVPGQFVTTSQDIYIYAETGISPDVCAAETSFRVEITPTPLPSGQSDVSICDSYTLPALTAGYHYYAVSGGPDAPGQREIPAGTVITTNEDPVDGSTTIYVYAAAAANPDCFTETSFKVRIYSASLDQDVQDIADGSGNAYWAEAAIETETTDPLSGQLVLDVEACDTFTLPNLNVGGTDPNDTYVQHYYTLQGGPDTPGQQQVNNLTFTATTTVYLYKQLIGRFNCVDESRITITINQTPVVDNSPTDFADCDSTTLPALTVGGYFNSPGGVDPITDLTLTESQTVYIYAQTGTNKICSDEHSFIVTINAIDVPDPADVVACETYNLPVPNPATARYFELAGGPNVPGQVERAVGYFYDVPGRYQLYVWDETNTIPNCTDEEQFEIRVVARPTGTIPAGLTTCAINDSGTQGIFDLTPAIAEAIGSQADVAATVHETPEDADRNTNAVPAGDIANYRNLPGAGQTLYIRLYSTLTNDCYTVVPLQLTVYPRPIAVDPIGPYALCDNGTDDADGIGVFDLTSYQDDVLGSLNPALHTVTYHESVADIQSGAAPIATPSIYNSASKTIYIKVTITATGCYDVVPLELIVNPLPVVTDPAQYSLCDVNPGPDGNPDEKEVFDLTSRVEDIVNGADGYVATFFTTLTDAQGNINAIPNPESYTNERTVQPIFIRIADNETGCFRIVLMDIRVEPLPVLTPPTIDELTVCSTNDEGYGNFDLDEIADDMTNGATDITVAFFYTLLDAERGNNAITTTDNFQTTELNQTIYVVATNVTTECRSIVYALNLVVNPAPAVVSLDDIRNCDDFDNNADGRLVFDLTQQDAAIYTQTGAAAGTLQIRYFTSEANARAGAPRITTPATYTSGESTIWVRVEYPDTECFSIASFRLRVNLPEVLTHPDPLIVCDDISNDGFAEFNLTLKDDEILGPTGVGEQNLVQYFILEADRDAATNAIPAPEAFTNTVAYVQTLFVLVTTPQGCVSKESLTIIVNPMPNPNFNPDPLVVCDDVTKGDGIEPFNLNNASANILAGSAQSVVTYYANAADEAAGIPIPDPTAYLNVIPWNDTVVARVTRQDTQPGAPACSQIVVLPLQVDPLPPVFDVATGEVPLYAICNENSTGIETFNLIGHITDLITAAGEDPTNFDIRFYLDLAAIAAGTPLPHNYTNVQPGQQQIYVVVRNFTTGCQIQTTLWLYAEEAAVANLVSSANNPIVECDDEDGDNDGFAQFDLTPAGAEALGTQNPAQFTVEYYTTEAAANAGDTTSADYIATPGAWRNTVYLTQTVWIRVTNTNTNAPCYAITSFDVRASLLPEPVITNDDNDQFICVDYIDGSVHKDVLLRSGANDPGYTYQWFLNGNPIAGATVADYRATEEGEYTVLVANADGCESEPVAAYEIFLSGPAEPINAGYVVSNAFGDSQSITVLVEGFGDYQYSLVPEDASGNTEPLGPWQNSNVFTNVPQGYFTIYVRDANTVAVNPCDMLVLTGVSVIDYPKYFTPNGDGINDYWNIVGMINHPEAKIYIFDRYGKLIKQLSPLSRTDQDQGWDGTFNGRQLPSDDYWFTVEFTENGIQREFKAHFALKR